MDEGNIGSQENLESVEQLKQQKKLKLYKGLMSAFVFVLVFLFVGVMGNNVTNSTEFCVSCHEMKPEHYTNLASSHAEVECVQCHTGVSMKEMIKAKGNIVVETFKKVTKTYTPPIQMPNEIKDSSCMKCHNMKVRVASPSGDLIIPHDKHAKNGVKCVTCHSGVSHGNIDERNITYSSDYDGWDKKLGVQMMSNQKFIRPQMEKCMSCHEAREISTKCETCHTTGMVPESHKEQNFVNGIHGQLATKELDSLENCNNCHKWMTQNEIMIFGEGSPSESFLSGKVETADVYKNVSEYIKENSFCKDCHKNKPTGHEGSFFGDHGKIANKNKEKCLTCHDYTKTGKNQVSKTYCGMCHPAMHAKIPWQQNHTKTNYVPTELSQKCYSCHSRSTCTACHRNK